MMSPPPPTPSTPTPPQLIQNFNAAKREGAGARGKMFSCWGTAGNWTPRESVRVANQGSLRQHHPPPPIVWEVSHLRMKVLLDRTGWCVQQHRSEGSLTSFSGRGGLFFRTLCAFPPPSSLHKRDLTPCLHPQGISRALLGSP